MQHDLGTDNDGSVLNVQTGERRDAQWYGINQYFLYTINPCWAMGLRFEWFRDNDGARVGGIGDPHGWTLGPNFANNQIGWAGNFYELTAGVNWTPRERLIVRPEIRWDWYSGSPDGLGRLPYNFGERSNQFTFATDIHHQVLTDPPPAGPKTGRTFVTPTAEPPLRTPAADGFLSRRRPSFLVLITLRVMAALRRAPGVSPGMRDVPHRRSSPG